MEQKIKKMTEICCHPIVQQSQKMKEQKNEKMKKPKNSHNP
jgi:hypothetical protein